MQALHTDIFGTIDEEVRAFWHKLEVPSQRLRLAASAAVHLLPICQGSSNFKTADADILQKCNGSAWSVPSLSREWKCKFRTPWRFKPNCYHVSGLQMASNERQRVLLRRLNAHLEGLSRAIEAVVSEGLSVRLEPVDLRLEKPTAESFHDSLQALFDAGASWPPIRHALFAAGPRPSRFQCRVASMQMPVCKCQRANASVPSTRTAIAFAKCSWEFTGGVHGDVMGSRWCAGITQRNVTRQSSRQVEGTEWIKKYRNGFCRLGEYYVGQPITRCGPCDGAAPQLRASHGFGSESSRSVAMMPVLRCMQQCWPRF